MIYFFYGTDIEKRSEARDDIARSFDSSFEMDDISWNAEKFENIAKSTSLFEAKQLIILENILENEEAKDFILERLDELETSGNVFIFLEKKALKDTVTKFGEYAQDLKEFPLPKGKKADVFAITYPLERRDKKNMWLEFQKLKNNIEPEQLSGMLFWKIKDMLLRGRNAEWSELELKRLSSKLVSLHHDAHRGLIDFRTSLEKFIIDLL